MRRYFSKFLFLIHWRDLAPTHEVPLCLHGSKSLQLAAIMLFSYAVKLAELRR
jgi:hypothetical protein